MWCSHVFNIWTWCTDSIRRAADLSERGYLFIGTGVSGGEEGARYGPSMMPGVSAVFFSLGLHLYVISYCVVCD